uniref:fructose-bisphosphate aldolase n=1 Tax=Nelumbo nucifera TaxID=4432 RepID=A0A822YH61_NELNU|nr:TPA_asm: hypothetical protein HUJ06_010781 [Nelumbo nucifera]
MVSAGLVKLNASSSQWIGQQSFNQRPGSSLRSAPRRVALPIRAGAYTEELVQTAKSIASPGRGILAIDESNATCGKRLASIGLDNTESNRQAYRQLLLTTPGLGEYISGAILFEETLYQSTTDGKKFVDCLREEKIVPGIKVDKGLVPLPGSNNESWCQGLDGLASRSAEYYKQGARFAKWRTVVSIPCGPSALAVKEAAWGLARYAAISQFLSGGQSEVEATLNLNAMNQSPNPWHVSFSYARALQNSVLKTWKGLPENVEAAQKALLVRAKANSLAQLGKYTGEGENEEAKKGMFVKDYKY